MENYSYSTAYPDSVHSSPRDIIDSDTASWDDQQQPSSNYKIKLMCSYGGKIQPRSHDNQLTYVGGDTKILTVDRTTKFSLFLSKLSSLCDADVCFKYQLPGEDLDALISVTNDEDLEHMMLEYDRLYRGSAKPARLRLFLFPINPPSSTFSSSESKSERQWFVDALNSVQAASLNDSSSQTEVPPPVPTTPDYLFGLEKDQMLPKPTPAVPEVVITKENHVGSECDSEDRIFRGEPMISPAEFQRMQIASLQEQANPRVYYGDYYGQKITENNNSSIQQQPAVPVSMSPAYWQERHMAAGGYPPASGTEQPVYMYQTPMVRPVTGQGGQGYYGMQRMVPEVYREQPAYNAVPQQQSFQQVKNMGGYGMGPGVGVGADHGYAQVGYDGAGRQVYYAAPGGVVPRQYQAADGRQGGGGVLNQEGGVKRDLE